MGSLLQDIRYGVRTLAKSPTFVILTVATLALAIGVNTAIFSMLNAVLIAELPIRDTDSMGFVYMENPRRNIRRFPVSAADFLDIAAASRSFAAIGAVNRNASFVLSGIDEPVRIPGFEATANIFRIWRQQAILGRTFVDGEDRLGAERVVLLAHGAWERRFGSDPTVIGRVIKVDGIETTIVGVLDPDLEFGSLAAAEIWVPLRIDRSAADREQRNLWISGRLAAGVGIEQAREEVAGIGQRLAAEYPETNANWIAYLADMSEALATDQIWTIMFLLALTVSFVMLIACSNVATMMLARASVRTKEIAVRLALGARRSRIVGQLLTEGAMLAVAAGALGLVLARLCLWGLVWMAGPNSGVAGFLGVLSIDRNALLFTIAVSAAAPLLFGFVPAVRASRPDLHNELKEGGRGNTGGGLRGRRFLVATQVALALSLMVVAGLLIRTMADARRIDIGFPTESLLTMRLDIPDNRYPDGDAQQQFYDQVMARVRALPGIRSAAWMTSRPVWDFVVTRNFFIQGETIPEAEETPFAFVNVLSAGALETLGLPLLAGRDFHEQDAGGSEPVALVNQSLADKHFDGDPLDQHIRVGNTGNDDGWIRIVGVFGNLHSGDPTNPFPPILALPMRQNIGPDMALVVRTLDEPMNHATNMREQVWAVDSEQPVGDMRTMARLISDALSGQEVIFTIFVAFAAFAVAMATAGIYGVISFAVSQRTKEIGIRMALGAQGRNVLGLITRQAVWLIAAGVVVGGIGAFLLSRVMASAVSGLATGDPLALTAVVAVFSLAAWLATYLPARRAIRIDPIIALRDD